MIGFISADSIQILILFVAIISIVLTVRNFKQQLQLNFFAEYTKRYQEITLNFPESINDENFNFNNLDRKLKEDILRYMRAYFDLCSEEYFLWKSGYIEKRVWNEWESGITYTFSKKAFKQGWKLIKLDTHYYRDFTSYINKIMQEQKKIGIH